MTMVQGRTLLHFMLLVSTVSGARIDSRKTTDMRQKREQASREEVDSFSWSEMGGVRNRRAAQQARQVSEEVSHNSGSSLHEVQSNVQRDMGNSIQVTPNMISTAQETNMNIDMYSENLGSNGNAGWANPESIVNNAGLPTASRMQVGYPGQNANERERHAFMQHLDALMSEATFMEHSETREDWEKHAILCDQGFQLEQKGKADREIEQHERELNEDFTQVYEGDENLRSGYSDGKIELIIRHPSLAHNRAGAPPEMHEYQCTSGCVAFGQRGSSGEDDMTFEPVVSPGVSVQNSGVAVLSAPGLFSYSFNYDTQKGRVDKSDIGFRGREYMTVTMADGVISTISVKGKKFQASSANEAVMSAEEHAFHCEAATINRHSKKITILTPHSAMPAFPNFLGSFDVTGLEHEEGDERIKGDADFLKVTLQACGPCNHRISSWNDNIYGLQEVNTGGEPCGSKGLRTSDGCPSSYNKKGYGVWYFTTKRFDTEVLPLLEQLETEMEIARSQDNGDGVITGLETNHTPTPNEVTGSEIYWDLQELVARIKDQETKFPWNQKMEAMVMRVENCGIQDVEESSMWGKKMVKKAVCPKDGTPSEIRYLHDGSLMHDSGEDVTFEFLHTTTDKVAPRPSDMLQGRFGNNALQGMSFSMLNTVMKGGMNWHVSVPRYGACVPVMEEYFYFGVGADTKCDLDLGVVLWSNAGGRLHVLDYMNYNRASRLGTSKVILGNSLQYSGDNRNAAGEGDDEWMMLKLNEIKYKDFGGGKRANYITIHVNIYEGASNFAGLEGAFARYVAGDPNAEPMSKNANGQNAFQVAHTINYLDLDACPTVSKYRSTILAMLFLENDAQVLLPDDVKDGVKEVSGTMHYELVTLGTGSSAQAAHNSTSQRELLEFWQNIHKLGKEEKVANNNAVTNIELGGNDVRTEVLGELPGGIDPMTNMIEAQHISHDRNLKEKDKEVDRTARMMGGGDKIVQESPNGYCFHMDMSGAVVMRHGCGVGGDAIRFEYGKEGLPSLNFILRDANFRCLQPTAASASAPLMMVDGCEDVWEMREVHGQHVWLHKTSNLCAGYATVPPETDTAVVLVDCATDAVAKLTEHLLVPGLFDNMLYEFPAGPPGSDALCFAKAKK